MPKKSTLPNKAIASLVGPPTVVYVIDWDKVTTVDDMKIILKELNFTVNIDRATEEIKTLLKTI